MLQAWGQTPTHHVDFKGFVASNVEVYVIKSSSHEALTLISSVFFLLLTKGS